MKTKSFCSCSPGPLHRGWYLIDLCRLLLLFVPRQFLVHKTFVEYYMETAEESIYLYLKALIRLELWPHCVPSHAPASHNWEINHIFCIFCHQTPSLNLLWINNPFSRTWSGSGWALGSKYCVILYRLGAVHINPSLNQKIRCNLLYWGYLLYSWGSNLSFSVRFYNLAQSVHITRGSG